MQNKVAGVIENIRLEYVNILNSALKNVDQDLKDEVAVYRVREIDRFSKQLPKEILELFPWVGVTLKLWEEQGKEDIVEVWDIIFNKLHYFVEYLLAYELPEEVIPAAKHNIDFPLKKIVKICKKHSVLELSVFGSVLREDFTDESDIDFLVRFAEIQGQRESVTRRLLTSALEKMLKREVDVISKDVVENLKNNIIRENILNSAKVLYAI